MIQWWSSPQIQLAAAPKTGWKHPSNSKEPNPQVPRWYAELKVEGSSDILCEKFSLLEEILGSNFCPKKKKQCLIASGNSRSHTVKVKNVSKKGLASYITLFSFKRVPQQFVGFMFKHPHSCSRKPQTFKTASNPVHRRKDIPWERPTKAWSGSSCSGAARSRVLMRSILKSIPGPS